MKKNKKTQGYIQKKDKHIKVKRKIKQKIPKDDIKFEASDYYMKPLEMTCLEPDDEDYFNVLRREHFIQSLQSLAFARNLPDITA